MILHLITAMEAFGSNRLRPAHADARPPSVGTEARQIT
jgi:hypothetical protein